MAMPAAIIAIAIQSAGRLCAAELLESKAASSVPSIGWDAAAGNDSDIAAFCIDEEIALSEKNFQNPKETIMRPEATDNASCSGTRGWIRYLPLSVGA